MTRSADDHRRALAAMCRIAASLTAQLAEQAGLTEQAAVLRRAIEAACEPVAGVEREPLPGVIVAPETLRTVRPGERSVAPRAALSSTPPRDLPTPKQYEAQWEGGTAPDIAEMMRKAREQPPDRRLPKEADE